MSGLSGVRLLVPLLGLLVPLGLVWILGPDTTAEPSASVHAPRSQGTVDRPSARDEWFYGRRAYPLSRIPDGAREKALAQRDRIPHAKMSPALAKAGATSLWTALGPDGFDSNVAPSWGRMSGRVRALAIDPTNADRLLLGTATGGVWLSNNGGQSWTALTDAAPSLAIGAVAFDPSNPQVLYAGTGEGNGSYYGVGLYKSVDGGANWSVLGTSQFNRGAISGIAIDPSNPTTVLVCAMQGRLLDRDSSGVGNTVGGIYRSTDGGQSYQRTAAAFCRGLYVVPDDFNTMYFSATGVGPNNGLYRSVDAGRSWQLVSNVVSGENVERLAVGLSRDGQQVYVGGSEGNEVVIQISNDGGNSFNIRRTPVPSGNDEGDPLSYCESQCGYDNVIAVNPFNPADVWFGGVGLYRSTDGGASFARVGENNNGAAPGPGPLHVDHHVLLFHPTISGLLYNGNDGGIYRSSNGGANWVSLGGTIGSLQHYHVSLHPTDPNVIYTGNQDNGTTRRSNSNVWVEVAGGDGAFSAVDHANPAIVYASTTELNILKSTNGGASFSFAGFEREQDEPVQFIAPFVMDPVDSQTLYAGTNRLWGTNDGGANWQPLTGSLVATEGASINDIAIAPSNRSVVYTVGSDGSVARVSNEGSVLVSKAPLPNRVAVDVVVDPANADIVYVSYSGFNSATPSTPGHVFRSSNGGASWTDVSGNLPDAPANALAIRPGVSQEIYVGTDAGMYISFSGGGSWARMDNGLPNAPISSLAVNATTNRLVAATYGRGSWQTSLGDVQPTGPLDEPSLIGASLPEPNPPNVNCPGGFFIARVDDGPGAGVSPGIFGVELLLDAPGTRILAGGLNFGGLIDVSQVGFAGANIANAAGENQLLNLSVTGNPTADPFSSLPVRITINRRSGDNIVQVFQTSTQINGSSPFTASVEVTPGYYETLVAADGFPASAAGGVPEGQFFFSLTTQFVDRLGGGFQGGAVVGGYHAANPFGGVSGFASFCIATPHSTTTRVFAAPSYGAAGARDLRLQLLDANQQVIYSVP